MTRSKFLYLIAVFASAGVLLSLSLRPGIVSPTRMNGNSFDQLLTNEFIFSDGDRMAINVAQVTVTTTPTPLVLAPDDVTYG